MYEQSVNHIFQKIGLNLHDVQYSPKALLYSLNVVKFKVQVQLFFDQMHSYCFCVHVCAAYTSLGYYPRVALMSVRDSDGYY